VGLDSVKAGRLAAAHLLAQGYRRINILFNPALHSHVEFYAGYSQALREAGVDPAQGKMASEGATPAQGYEAGKRVVAAGEPAEGYIIFSDAVASGFVRALNEAGVRVPQDVAVVGGENILKEELYYSPLSAVDRKYEERGQQAAEMLIQAIEKGAGLRPEIQNRILEPALVIRASSQRSNTK
jgi:DNA-binding LacI/PurR family transcriptional regulator